MHHPSAPPCHRYPVCPAPLLFALIFLLASVAASARALPPLLARADRYFQQKSYAAALKEYERTEKAGQVPEAYRSQTQYRIAVSLGKTEQWDRALARGLDFVKTHRNTVWEPRGLYWLGRLYLAAPGVGYRLGKIVYRGLNVPKTTGSEKPQAVTMAEEDRRNALEAMEAARVLYSRYPPAMTAPEQIQLDFDLAHMLSNDPRFAMWGLARKWAPPESPEWRVDPGQVYSPDWEPPKKKAYLYAHIQTLAAKPTAHSSALALLDKALWLRQYQAAMRSQYAIRWENAGQPEEKQIAIPFPYQNEEPVAILRQLIHDFPDDPVRDQTQFLLASLLAQDGKLTDAVKEYRSLITVHPKSKWGSDSRLQLAQIRRRTLALNSVGMLLADRPPRIRVTTRNMNQARFQLYRVSLEHWIGNERFLHNADVNMQDSTALFGSLKRIEKKLGRPVAQWTRTVADKGDYQPQTLVLTLPVRSAGAYMLIASGPDVRVANLFLVTDLVLVQKNERDRALFYATDARTGRPAAGVNIIAKEWYNEPAANGSWVTHSLGLRGVTNADGVVSIPLERKARRRTFQMAALGFRSGGCALTGQSGFSDSDDNHGRFKSYCTTDRAVYRPFQTVRYRDLVMERGKDGLKPVIGKRIHVEVLDAKSRRIYARLLTSSEFGSVNGEFELPADAPLGEYAITCSVYKVETNGTEAGGNRFRVEEYKKPEYEVTVVPEAERVRLGQPTSARVTAKYYFGSPVAGAKVAYRVYRSAYSQSYTFPAAFDFLYSNSSQGGYDTNFRNGEVIAQGSAQTDEKGEAKITFPTQADGAQWRNQDLSYTVEADVKDSSRRTITGTGAVKATQHDVAVFLNYPHGYATKGDRLDVEIVTLNPSDLPVSVEGSARVFRQSRDPKGKETLVSQQPLATDAHGRTYLRWTADRAGYYRIAFVTRDTAGLEVEGETFVWVQGPELARGEFHNKGIFLAVQNPYYEEGQSARVLIATEEPNCAVLLTREVNNQILDKRVVRISGQSLEVFVPLAHRDAPNVYVSAVMIRNGELFQASQEIFVPPVSRLAKVKVEADRQKYQPGEKAKLRLSATDWHNRPLRTELAVSISDAALNYIQKDYAPDIRVYYYGDRRSESITSAGSVDTAFQPLDEDRQPTLAYQTHELLMPDGMGLLDDWPSRRLEQHSRSRSSWAMSGYMSVDGSNLAAADAAMSGLARDERPVSRAGQVLFDVAAAEGKSVPIAAPGRPMSLRALPSSMAGAKQPQNEGQLAQPTLRSHFADTAFWTPAVVTDAQGSANVEVTWPDNLTQWKAQAVGSTVDAQVGTSETRVTTRKDLLVRLEAPRYFVERDTMTISAIVQNYTPELAHTKVQLNLDGNTLDIPEHAAAIDPTPNTQHPTPNPPEVWVDIPADGEKRIDWIVHVHKEGQARIRMTAQAASAADATETTFPVLIHGVERAVAQSGVLHRQDSRAEISIDLPEARKQGSSELVVQVNPSLAAVMLDALPYLNDYPYGCIEQTMSRFLPSVLTARTLKEQGFKLEDLRRRMQALEQQAAQGRGNLQIAESPYTYPDGKPGTSTLRLSRWSNPVFDSRKLDKMVAAGLARIAEYQHGDGGWGWWKDDKSDAYMTAYVLYGLLEARGAGIAVEPARIQRGMEFLLKRFRDEDSLHLLAYEGRVLAMEPAYRDQIRPSLSGRVFSRRERLSAYSKALLALALRGVGDKEKAVVLLQNLENTVKVDTENGTASWGESDNCWWRWYNDKVETNATVLQAYMAIQPDAKIPPMLVKWLVSHRQGDNWASTRETAIAVYALSDYIRINKELSPNYTLTLDLGGRIKRAYRVNRENALLFDNRFVVPDALLRSGAQTLTITKEGTGTCYYGAYTRYFSREDSIPASGNEIFVSRRYFRLLPGTASGQPEAKPVVLDWPNPFLTGSYELLEETGQPIGTGDTDEGPRYERAALNDGDTVTSGDLLEVELQIESKNDYEYLAFEDLKPAGCEPVELRSGGKAGEGVYSNMELRDQKVAFFISSLPQGRRSLSYRLRAEAPGQFHVLPTNGYAMYAPTVRTLSSEQTLTVKDDTIQK